MKKFFACLFLVLVYWQTNAQQNPFVRVYNLQGMKMNSGRVFAATDSSLQLKARRGEVIDLPAKTIGAIKIGRTTGHNISIGALSGGVLLGLIAGLDASGNDAGGNSFFTPAQTGVIVGVVLGMPIGAAAGGITALFKKSNIFIIDGRSNQWKEFQFFIEAKRESIKNE